MAPAPKSRAERVGEAVQMCRQARQLGLLSSAVPGFGDRFKEAYVRYVADGTPATLCCAVDAGGRARTSVQVVFSATRQSGITMQKVGF